MVFKTLGSVLLASTVVAAASLSGRDSSSASPSAVYANFPSYGPSEDITGVLVFENLGSNGVQISSSGDTELHSFPAELGPFLYHSNSHARDESNR